MDFLQTGNVIMFFLIMVNLGLYGFGLIDLPSNQEIFPFLPAGLTTDFNADQNAAQVSDYLQQNLSSTGSVTASSQTTPLPQSQIVQQLLGGTVSIFKMGATFPFWGVYAMQKAHFPGEFIFIIGSMLIFFQGVYLLFVALAIWNSIRT